MIRLVAFFVLLQVLDVASTLVGLAAGASEQNPIGAAALRGGPWLLLLAKMIGTALILYVAARVHEGGENGPTWARSMLAWCCVIMTGVVLWNGSVIVARLGA